MTPETNLVINIGIYKTLGLIATLIAGAWYLSHRLTKVETKVGGVASRMSSLEGRMDKAFSGGSPIQLLPKGQKILTESGLKEWIDNNENLFENCSSKYPMSNPYDVQNAVFKFFDEMVFGKELEDKVKKSAFENGVNIETVRRIGGIYFRDVCLKKLNMNFKELDKSEN